MSKQVSRLTASKKTRTAVQAFYDLHPYPPPVDDLAGYRQRWQDETRRRADYHLHWPEKPYRPNLKILIAGCGTTQAAKYALRQPDSQVVGIDFSETSIRFTETLKQKYRLTNLELYQLPIEQAGELGRRFDKIVCTGVLHHLPDPQAGLRALRDALEPDGALNLMVYARYGRAGIYLLQEYCRRLEVGHSEREIRELATTLTALPPNHPLARLLGESPDFQRKDALADALLNPQDCAYSVPQLFELIEECGLAFSRWVRQAPYLPQCGSLASTPHAIRLAGLSPREQFAAVELFRGTMLRHSLIACRGDWGNEDRRLHFDNDEWTRYIPTRLPDALIVQKRLPPGAAAILLNQAHEYPDIYLPISADELQLVEAIDGKKRVGEIIQHVYQPGAGSLRQFQEQAGNFFEQLYWYDQVVFDAAYPNGK